MKKIIFTLLISTGVFNYAQVIIGSQADKDGTFLQKEDLEVNKSEKSDKALKVEYIEPLCDKPSDENGTENCPPYSQTFIDTENHNKLVKGVVPKVFQKLVFYIKLGNQSGNISEFDTKIDATKYNAILVGSDILESNKTLFAIPDVDGKGLHAVKNVALTEKTSDDGKKTWAIKAGYSSSITNSPIWRIQLLLMDKSFVSNELTSEGSKSVYDLTKSDIDRTYPKELEGKNVGIGETEPKANLDVKGNFYLRNVTDVTNFGKDDGNLKNTTVPIVADISKKENGKKSDKWGLLKSGNGEKVAYPIQLDINMGANTSQADFVFYLTLGLDPNKYTPILGNAQLTCDDSNNYYINTGSTNYPTLNTFVEKTKNISDQSRFSNGKIDDWALYLDYNGGQLQNCNANKAHWRVFLLVFKNKNLINVPVNGGNDIDISGGYDENTKGYKGSIDESPMAIYE